MANGINFHPRVLTSHKFNYLTLTLTLTLTQVPTWHESIITYSDQGRVGVASRMRYTIHILTQISNNFYKSCPSRECLD